MSDADYKPVYESVCVQWAQKEVGREYLVPETPTDIQELGEVLQHSEDSTEGWALPEGGDFNYPQPFGSIVGATPISIPGVGDNPLPPVDIIETPIPAASILMAGALALIWAVRRVKKAIRSRLAG
jgi:hypothetical protein